MHLQLKVAIVAKFYGIRHTLSLCRFDLIYHRQNKEEAAT